MPNHPVSLETISVDVPEAALEAYEAALSSACATVGFFRDHTTGDWRVEGVKPVGSDEPELAAALALAAALSGVSVPAAADADAGRRAGWRAPMPRSRNSTSAGGSPCAERICTDRRRRAGSP